MVQEQEQSMNRRRQSTIQHAGNPLSSLASQLHSETDRMHYAKVIAMAESLQRRIQNLQHHDKPAPSPSSPDPPEMNSSPSSDNDHPQDCPQEFERYYRLLERSRSIQRTIARLSDQFDDNLVNKPMPPPPGSPHHHCPPLNKTTPLAPPPPPPPLHPPPSFPLPPTPTASPPANGRGKRNVNHAKRLPSIPIRNSRTTTPPPTPQKHPPLSPHLMTAAASAVQEQPITPPDSPQQQMRFRDREDDGPPLPPPPPPPPVIRIKHVQKRINGFRGFLTRTYQLSSDLVMSHALTTPLRLFTATEMMTGEPKAILKVVLTTPLLQDYGSGFTENPDESRYGFSFYWPAGPKQPLVKPNRAFDMEQFANVPDHLVQEALDRWLMRQHILPPLHQATHILRQGIKIYVVYNRSLFQHLSL